MGKTSIEWTDESSNPIKFRMKETGKVGWACIKKSAGCMHCYSERFNKRFGTGHGFTVSNMDLVEPFLDEKELARLQRLKGPRKVFICDMTDIFGEFVPTQFIIRVFDVMIKCPDITFQVLTKRADRMHELLSAKSFFLNGVPPSNIWLGVSVENQQAADERIPLLLKTPAAVRFLSCEPLLGPIDLGLLDCPTCGGSGEVSGNYFAEDGMETCRECGGKGTNNNPKIDQVIAGGESGYGARPMFPDWARGQRDQCLAAGVPFLFKQWGEWKEVRTVDQETVARYSKDMIAYPNGDLFFRVGKKAAGRVLDGRTWHEFPETKK